ncbi:MAG TPA: hypothetical protein VFI03_10970 [Solirubrobacterales bacterium]|nr:hypothetical protein [Solirubrobacterales bacterium]
MSKRLTYANVVATLALFLALSGGVVWAAGKIGTKNLKANAVSAGKIKANAVTSAKIRANAVTTAKLKNGAVNLDKLAPGTNLLASASGGPVAANGAAPVVVPLAGAATFTPAPGTVAFLSVEAKGNDLARAGEKDCEPRIAPFVNGSQWDVAEGVLKLRAFAPTAEQPTGLVPVSGETGPIGLTSPGVAQTVSIHVIGDPNCSAASTVSVGIAVTQVK